VIFKIVPYKYGSELVFDQEEYGLIKEPLIEGVPEILYELCERHNVSSEKFDLYFSDEPFEGFQLVADKLREYGGGFWYQIGAKEGWLCPAMFFYFDSVPKNIYFKVESNVEKD
jgi:hypothetical protein